MSLEERLWRRGRALQPAPDETAAQENRKREEHHLARPEANLGRALMTRRVLPATLSSSVALAQAARHDSLKEFKHEITFRFRWAPWPAIGHALAANAVRANRSPWRIPMGKAPCHATLVTFFAVTTRGL